jgi:hypothetical protein
MREPSVGVRSATASGSAEAVRWNAAHRVVGSWVSFIEVGFLSS